MSIQEQNLNSIMQYAIKHQQQTQFRLYTQLKFRNTLFAIGDDILLHSDAQQVYAKIVNIATIQHIQFPLLQVCWYMTLNDPQVAQQAFTHLDKRELIFSEDTDWQYVQALKGKITVLSEQQFALLDSRQSAIAKRVFCRSMKVPNSYSYLDRMPEAVCKCMKHYNPSEKLNCCVACGTRFHPSCSKSVDICPSCIY